MSIRDMEMLGIGKPNDVGGTETEGTVMAKENAIMKMIKDYDEKVKNNMILKQTPTKTFKLQNAVLNFDFDLGKPVRILGIYLSFSPELPSGSSSYPTLNLPVYIINGEDSFRTSLQTKNSTFGIFCRIGSGVGFFSEYQNMFPIPDIWATRLTLQFYPGYAKDETNVSAYVLYQEEG